MWVLSCLSMKYAFILATAKLTFFPSMRAMLVPNLRGWQLLQHW